MRKKARDVAFKAIYESLFNNNQMSFDAICEDNSLSDENDIVFAKSLYDNWINNRQDIEQKIKDKVANYEYDRIYKIDVALIGLAISEILYFKETPRNVVFNEVIDLSKKYSTEKSYAFINGVLKNILEE